MKMKIPNITRTSVPDLVLDHLARLEPDEARVLLAIAVVASRKYDHQWWVGIDAIAQQAKLTQRRAKNAIARLIGKSLLQESGECAGPGATAWRIDFEGLYRADAWAAISEAISQ